MNQIVTPVNITVQARGIVSGHWVNPKTQETKGHFSRRNQLTYGCADVLARLLGGGAEYAPKHLGFIYGTTAAPALSDPATRTHTWTSLASELSGVAEANMQISPHVLVPTFGISGSDELYAGNAVTFTAHSSSGAGAVYGFPLSAPYAGALSDGDWIYHAVLLTKLVRGATTEYLPVARVSLEEAAVFPQKPVGWELALYWQVSFF